MSSQKGARSKLADVLADIKSSRIEDEYDYNNHDIAPTPAKRRSAVNYVALSGHTPRSSRSSNVHASSSQSSQQNHDSKTPTTSNNNSSNNKSLAQQQSTNATTNLSTVRTRTYILKLFDRTVDLAQFTEDKSCEDSPLYPICRAWVNGHRSGHSSQHNKSEPPTPQVSSTAKQMTTEKNNNESSPSATKQDSPTLTEASTLEIHSMPLPKSKLEVMKQLKQNTDNVTESTDIRIPPSVRDFKPQENVAEMIDNSIKSMDHQECINLNRQRWKKVRRDWSESRRIHEARYEESFKILHGMFAQQRGI